MSNLGARQAAVVAARRALDIAEAERDDAIREALANGATVATVAAATGLHRQRIYQIRDRRR